jgi:acetyl-CoA C-acetyltransferase
VIASEEYAKKHGRTPLAKIIAYCTTGIDPAIMGMGPVSAIRKALERAKLEVKDIDLIELNEAFASQALGVIRELGLDPSRINIYGGAIALGHPIGASGARVVTTLVHAMRERNARYGIASLCIGGGMGTATIVERV